MNDDATPMQFSQLVGRYARLGRELLRAQANDHGAVIDRLAADLIDAQDTIAAYRPIDEQCSEPLLSYARVVLVQTMRDECRVEPRTRRTTSAESAQP